MAHVAIVKFCGHHVHRDASVPRAFNEIQPEPRKHRAAHGVIRGSRYDQPHEGRGISRSPDPPPPGPSKVPERSLPEPPVRHVHTFVYSAAAMPPGDAFRPEIRSPRAAWVPPDENTPYEGRRLICRVRGMHGSAAIGPGTAPPLRAGFGWILRPIFVCGSPDWGRSRSPQSPW